MRVQARRVIADLRRELGAPDGDGNVTAGAVSEAADVEGNSSGGVAIPPLGELAERVARRLEEAESRLALRPVINATGIFLHTNLGRAPLPEALADEVRQLLTGYCDLEIDLESGRRSERNVRIGALLRETIGAGDAILVNNNAGALTLALFALARGREVVISRGELVEIGGSFRIPEILETAGARLREVGTTNRTRVADYARAIGPETGLLLKVFPSNYRIEGFTEAASAGELAALSRQTGVPLLVDEGSGLLQPLPREKRPAVAHESLAELIALGCDLVCASGDKWLGGPQAGLLAGREDLVELCRRSPLYRALRPDRFAYAATEAILRWRRAGRELPIDRLWPEPEAHRRRVRAMAERLGAGEVMADGYVGAGCAPGEAFPALAVALPADEALLRQLRRGGRGQDGEGLPPVVAYLREDRLVLDLRTVDPGADEQLARAVEAARERLEKRSGTQA